jgi:hypothetical protein
VYHIRAAAPPPPEARQQPGKVNIPFVQALHNGLSRGLRCSYLLLLQLDQDPQTAIGKAELQEQVCILDRPDASFDPHMAGEQLPTELSGSWLGDIHRSKIGQHGPRLNLLEAAPYVRFDPQSSAHADRDAWAMLANGDEGGHDVFFGQRLLSPRGCGVDMQGTPPCRDDVLQKSIADGSSNSFSLPSTHSTGSQKVYPMTVSCMVLERISQVAWTSDKLSKELSRGLFRSENYLFKQGEETIQR